MIDHNLLIQSDKVLNHRYSKRFMKFGDDPRTLGWDTLENQRVRFNTATNTINMSNLSILDVGCGLADFHAYLRNTDINISSYTGIDINSDLIEACRKKDHEAKDFKVRNILTNPMPSDSYDIVTMFGVLNFKFKKLKNETFAKEMIKQGFNAARNVLVVDMLSTKIDSNYPVEDFVYYYDPSKILDFALSLTPYVQMRHDYASIPQREFLLVLKKMPWK
jgi:SAM-dependent methyltransferase